MNKKTEKFNKEFVTYEIAVAVKNLGFNEKCIRWYALEYSPYFGGKEGAVDLVDFDEMFLRQNKELDYKYWDAPMWQQVQKWLRKKHQIYIEILTDCTTEPKFCFKIDKFIGNPEDLTEREWDWIHHTDFEWCLYYTYEQALEEAIKEAIKII